MSRFFSSFFDIQQDIEVASLFQTTFELSQTPLEPIRILVNRNGSPQTEGDTWTYDLTTNLIIWTGVANLGGEIYNIIYKV